MGLVMSGREIPSTPRGKTRYENFFVPIDGGSWIRDGCCSIGVRRRPGNAAEQD